MIALASMATNAVAQSYMPAGTLDYPSGYYSAFPPSSVSVSYGNQPIQLIDPHLNDFEEEAVTVYVILGEGEETPVDAGILTSFGDPENPEDGDIWCLDIALYNLEDLWSFDGNTVTVIIPEGVVKNQGGDINPAQTMEFFIVPTFTDYTYSPESGSTLTEDLTVRVNFANNSLERLQAEVRALVYEPTYRDIALPFGESVTISEDNELLINLGCLETGSYELIIPEGYVLVEQGGEKYLSPDIWLEYTVENDESGLRTVEITDVTENIYNLQGVKLNKTPGKGIFIVNGRKVAK